MVSPNWVTEFITGFKLTGAPRDVIDQAKRCTCDLVAAAAGGISTQLSHIVRNFCVRYYPPGVAPSRMMFDGRQVTRAAAALAGGMTLDAFDIHDGHRLAKGHAGAGVLPAVLAYSDSSERISGPEMLAATIIGYEVGLRAGVIMNRSRGAFPSSGAWVTIGVAAVGARLLALNEVQCRHALGIAEYHSPVSPVTRTLENPTMLKDGIGWGAFVGVSAADLAAEGFTGAPPALCEAPDLQDVWSDLGERWYMRELYFRTMPSCRMAQPAIDAALSLVAQHKLAAGQIKRVVVSTFAEAKRLMNPLPQTAEEAQYSLPYILAVALTYGRVRPAHLRGDAFADPKILRLSRDVSWSANHAFDEQWPSERLAQVKFELFDGRTLESEVCSARGDPENPISKVELDEKYAGLVEPVVGQERAQRIAEDIACIDTTTDGRHLLDELLSPVRQKTDGVVA